MSEPDAGPCNCRPRLLRLCGIGEQHLVEAHVVQRIDRAPAQCRKLIVDLEHLMLRITDRETTDGSVRSEEHTSELQSLMRRSYAVFCLKKKRNKKTPKSTI